MLVLTKGINNHGSKFENFTRHVTTSTTESTPVGKDHNRQTLVVEVLKRLSRFIRGVREKNLSSLGQDRLTRIGVSRVGWNNSLHKTSLNRNRTHRNTTKTSTANNNTLAPSFEVFFKASLVEESSGIISSREHEAGIIRSRGWLPLNLTVNRIRRFTNSWQGISCLGDEAEPLDDGLHTLLVIINNFVCATIGVHNLRTTKLVLRCVHFATKKLVQSTITSEKHGSLFHLDNTLTKADKVGSNTNTATSDITQSEDLIIRSGCFSRNLSTSLKILHTNAFTSSNDILDGPAFRHLLYVHRSLRQ
mmetsp:Transcript_3551/g.6682  ORF Transcript_3551/g.6682 Transcript_3551/m.6682 type:complete len:305 (-) Transcript_3551:211-1125(-)